MLLPICLLLSALPVTSADWNGFSLRSSIKFCDISQKLVILQLPPLLGLLAGMQQSVLSLFKMEEGTWCWEFQPCSSTFLIILKELGVGVISMSALQWSQGLDSFCPCLLSIHMGTPQKKKPNVPSCLSGERSGKNITLQMPGEFLSV